MNEIEKLYKNAGLSNMWVEEYDDNQIWHKSYEDMIKSMMKINDWDREVAISIAKKECRKAYPPFTADKQLELIKFLLKQGVYYDVDDNDNYWFHITDDCYTYYYNKFEIALANIINEMWQDLTSEEKEQVREILE